MLNEQQKKIIAATLPVVAENLPTIVGKFYQKLFINHPELKNLFNQTNQKTGFQQQALTSSIAAFVINYEENLLRIQPMLKQIAFKHVSLGITGEMYQIVADNLMAAIAEVLKDAVTEEVADAWVSMYWELANTLIDMEKDIYGQNKVLPNNFLSKCSLINRVTESSNTFSLYFKANPEMLQNYVPGQYVSIKVNLEDNKHQFRQYSISDFPNQDIFRVTIKREEELFGVETVSNNLFKNALQNTEWELSYPAGNFSIVNPQKTIVLLSVGIGVTPIFAMLKQLLSIPCNSSIFFIHLTENSNYHTFKTELVELNDERLTKCVVYRNPLSSNLKDIDYNIAGNFNFNVYSQFILEDADYYLCASPQFIKATKLELTKLGIPLSNIYAESFEPDAYN